MSMGPGSIPTDTTATSAGRHRASARWPAPPASIACITTRTNLDLPRLNRNNPPKIRTHPHPSGQIWTNLDNETADLPSPAGNPPKLPRNPARPSRSAPITRSHGTTPSVTSRDTTPKSPGFARCSANRRSGATRPSHSLASAALSPARLPTDNPPPEKGPPCT